jgi:hypothetical protein
MGGFKKKSKSNTHKLGREIKEKISLLMILKTRKTLYNSNLVVLKAIRKK